MDNLWDNPLNWEDNSLPLEDDEILFDNTFLSNSYSVILPSFHVIIKSITIVPVGTNTIEVVLPNSVTEVPALTITGSGYGLVINDGGVFRNSSGAASGTPLVVNDSIRINNGGKLIINTPRAHASIVDRLSALPGTEEGVVEFDVPVASSTISLSGRTYGKLVLKSTAYGRWVNYTAVGINKVNIRSDLEIMDSVSFNLNFSDTVMIGGHLVQNYSVFNVGNSSRSITVAVKGNMFQDNNSILTESGSAVQRIVLNGEGDQLINMNGTIINEIEVVKNGSGNATLMSSLTLPYSLHLMKGNINSSAENPLILSPTCVVMADTINNQSHINGPLTKYNLANDDFLFPVGDGLKMRWLMLMSATGSFTVRYINEDPHVLSEGYGEGIERVSKIEYWDIHSVEGAQAKVKLSFHDPHSGGVTDLNSLKVAWLGDGIWMDHGSTLFAGTAGSNGWIYADRIHTFSGNDFFALASALGLENPLPFHFLEFEVVKKADFLWFTWKVDKDHSVYQFDIQESDDNYHYSTIDSKLGDKNREAYIYKHSINIIRNNTIVKNKYYRIRAVNIEGAVLFESKVNYFKHSEAFVKIRSTAVYDYLWIDFFGSQYGKMELTIIDIMGVVQKNIMLHHEGSSVSKKIDVRMFKQGIYYLNVRDLLGNYWGCKFIKL